MERRQQQGLSFAVPHGWHDRTVIAFVAPPSAPATYLPNIVITREPLAIGDTLQTHADRALLDMAAQLADFDLIERVPWNVDGRRAVRARCAWKSGVDDLEQDLTICEAPLDANERTPHALAITITASRTTAAQLRHLFDSMLVSLRFEAGRAARVSGLHPAHETPAPVVPMFGASRR